MHDHGGRGTPARPPRRRWRRPRLAALVGALALTLAVAACGGGGESDGVASLNGSTPTTSGSNTSGSKDPKQAALAFAKCMRQHGIDMPDPKFDADGSMTQQYKASRGNGPNDPKFKAAQQACQQYQPDGGNAPKPNPQEQQQMLQFARCMREHGVNIPDPKPGGGIEIGPEAGVNPDDPKFKAAQQACRQYEPKGGQEQTQSNGGGA